MRRKYLHRSNASYHNKQAILCRENDNKGLAGETIKTPQARKLRDCMCVGECDENANFNDSKEAIYNIQFVTNCGDFYETLFFFSVSGIVFFFK